VTCQGYTAHLAVLGMLTSLSTLCPLWSGLCFLYPLADPIFSGMVPELPW
jgi:hypothetical protein